MWKKLFSGSSLGNGCDAQSDATGWPWLPCRGHRAFHAWQESRGHELPFARQGEKGAEFSSWVEGDCSLARVNTSVSSRDLGWEHRIRHACYQQGSASPIWPMHTGVCEKTSLLRNFTVLSQTTFFVCLYFLVCGGKCSACCGARAAPPRARWQ